MKFIPHDYQTYAIDYIKSHRIAALFLDCGLGKTAITLSAINDLKYDDFDVRKVLIIGPKRVIECTWPEEIKKWDHLSLTYSLVAGSRAERVRALRKEADLYLVSRDNVQWLVEQSGIPFDFDMIVIDELSSFKNYRAKRFKALMKVRPRANRIVALTGTPTSNGLMDLFSEFKLLDGGKRLGRFITQYREAYFVPDKMNANVIFSYRPVPGAEEYIYKKISDITVSMQSIDHLQMPDLLSVRYDVFMSEAEREKYDELKKEMVLSLPEGEITASNAATLSNKLLQMSSGALYDEEKNVVRIHDQKLDALEDIIEAANGKPLLVAYWFKHDLDRIEERLNKLGISYGRIDNEKNIIRWNRKELTVGLIHPASAGHGINLQAGGSHLVWFSLTWSLELYQQTNARLYRQGQKAKTVVIQHIVTAGTRDERVLKALESKDKTQTSLIEAVKAVI